jgi:hypothetical protein
MECVGLGVTQEVDPEVWEEEAVPVRIPPGVMRDMCPGCACRPGSPERVDSPDGLGPGPDHPFYCHKGLVATDDGGYSAAVSFNGDPVGALVCRGWYLRAIGRGQEVEEAANYIDDHPFRARS